MKEDLVKNIKIRGVLNLYTPKYEQFFRKPYKKILKTQKEILFINYQFFDQEKFAFLLSILFGQKIIKVLKTI